MAQNFFTQWTLLVTLFLLITIVFLILRDYLRARDMKSADYQQRLRNNPDDLDLFELPTNRRSTAQPVTPIAATTVKPDQDQIYDWAIHGLWNHLCDTIT